MEKSLLDRSTLSLTRRESEVIKIGDHIDIRVDRINNKQVHLSIIAPKFISVHRLEIWEGIQNAVKND